MKLFLVLLARRGTICLKREDSAPFLFVKGLPKAHQFRLKRKLRQHSAQCTPISFLPRSHSGLLLTCLAHAAPILSSCLAKVEWIFIISCPWSDGIYFIHHRDDPVSFVTGRDHTGKGRERFSEAHSALLPDRWDGRGIEGECLKGMQSLAFSPTCSYWFLSTEPWWDSSRCWVWLEFNW